jgi:hypothetical protein
MSTEENLEQKNDHKRLTWSVYTEDIMIEWCDIAKCYNWMHMRAHAKYSRYNMWFTIPSIVLSTISGTASFAQGNMSGMAREYAPMAIGTINISVGIINTIQQFFKVSQLQEAHRVSYIAWDKFARNIVIELSKNPSERTEASAFFKQSRNEYDRLMETSPVIPNNVIRDFMRELNGENGSARQTNFNELRKPDICNTIISSKHSSYRTKYENISDFLSPALDTPAGKVENIIIRKLMEFVSGFKDIIPGISGGAGDVDLESGVDGRVGGGSGAGDFDISGNPVL